MFQDERDDENKLVDKMYKKKEHRNRNEIIYKKFLLILRMSVYRRT